MLEYKLAWRGKQLVKVGRFFPSSQLCSPCGYQYHELTIDHREWTCPACGVHHGRDVNASINIKREGIRILRDELNINVMTLDATAGTARSHARGDLARPASSLARVGEPGIHAL
jgi:putative transposase